jgi:hypothetical protein
MNLFMRPCLKFTPGTVLLCFLVAIISSARPAAQDRPAVRLAGPFTNGWQRLEGTGDGDRVHTLLASTNLFDWSSIATLHGAPFTFADPASVRLPRRFYRVSSEEKTPAHDWKNQVTFPDDPFFSFASGADAMRWVKFAIVLSELDRVYFQDSFRYPFHYEFAVERLAPFRGMSREVFNQVSLGRTNQQVVLGALVFPEKPGIAEYGVQFVGRDPYPKEQVRQWFELVKSTVAGAVAQPLYLPTFEQAASANAERDWFAALGITLSSSDRWLPGNICYSSGWALGTVKFIPAAEITAAYADGRLRPQDILLTDGIPAELPYVSGIISLAPSTPNSHVAILAKSYGVPFVYLLDPADRARAQSVSGREVLFRGSDQRGGCDVTLAALPEPFDPALRSEILALKSTAALAITPKAVRGAISASTDSLTSADVRFFGGKAANFGYLRRSIPTNSPEAIALSFDLWDSFMDQTLPGGKTLRAEIAERLEGFSYPPADVNQIKSRLAEIRDLITKTAAFTPAQQQAVQSALGGFNPARNIRFRSSTNVEDTERFTGAGLYDSFSGCLADDQDGDTRGPSACDPTENGERGVFRAIQKVYASFYNDNAYLERLRHKVNEAEVGMALLVHHSFPDEFELANGVATVRRNGSSVQADIVSQLGAVSITNPDGSARPEVVTASKFGFGTFFDARERSSLVPLGAHVMDWEADYKQLLDLLSRAADAYAAAFPTKQQVLLDFEYKKVSPGRIEIKQVREIPGPDSTNAIAPFLINHPAEYWVFQGEFADVFANHRLKSTWHLSTRSLRISTTEPAQSLYTNVSLEYLEGTILKRITNGIASWPGASHAATGDSFIDRWTLGAGAQTRQYQLTTSELPRTVRPPNIPLFVLDDLMLTLQVQYSQPVPTLDFARKPGFTSLESVRLVRRPQPSPDDLLQERTFKGRDAVRIHSAFYWPKAPTGITAGYTAPLVRWQETRLEGLTSEPIVLKDDFSQTYRPEHHNFGEQFVFEPQLAPDLPPAIREELTATNIKLLHVYWDFQNPIITVLGFDGTWRALSP